MHARKSSAVLLLLTLVFGALVAGTAQAAEFDVEVGDVFFAPDELFVNVGDTVNWTWGDGTDLEHNVTALDESFVSETTNEGTFSHTFTEAGENPYRCTLHSSPDGTEGQVGVVNVLPQGEPLPEPPPEPRPAPAPGDLPAGEDAVGTSLVWSSLFPDGGAAVALVGRDDAFADSLSSGGVQGFVDAPLLLTPSDELDQRVADELERLGSENVVIFGGEAAIAPEVEAAIQDLGIDTQRVEGATRIETAIAAAVEFFRDADTAILARSDAPGSDDPTRAFADSLGAGAFAARQLVPILLSETDQLSDSTRDYLANNASIETMIVAGGTAALSEQVVSDLEALDITVERVAGSNRFETAAQLAIAAFPGQPPGLGIVVEGQAEDAWVGGFTAASAAESAALVLTNGNIVPNATAALALPSPPSFRTPVLCGPSATDAACQQVTAVSNADIPFPSPGARVAALAGEEEVPGPGDPAATGDATIVRTPDDPGIVCYDVTYNGTEAIAASHIHEGAAGVAGDVVVPLNLYAPFGPGFFFRGCTFDVDQALLADIFENPANYYANLHTNQYPMGAVRGQLLEGALIGIAELSGDAEVPGPGATEGGGFSLVMRNVDDPGQLCYFYAYELAEPAMAAHIHEAPEGEAGPVVHPLQLPTGPSTQITACDQADPALIADMAANPADYYVNVHTETFPQGAVRGQLFDPFSGGPGEGPPPS